MNTYNKPQFIDEAQARRLLAAFFDGATSIDEERQLYAYFRDNARIPSDIRRYAPMFGWFSDGMPEAALQPEVAPVPLRRHPARQLWAFVASTAAMVALVVTLGVSYSGRASDQYSLYEGSFVMHDGRKITDLRSIMPQLRRAEAIADASFSNIPSPEDMTTDAMTPEMRQAVAEILDY